MLVADLDELESTDASEIYSKRLNAKEVIFPKEKGDFIFPIADGRIKPLGRDQDLRTSTLIRQLQLQGESHIDFLGESEGSLPPHHDSFPDAGEAFFFTRRREWNQQQQNHSTNTTTGARWPVTSQKSAIPHHLVH